MENKLSLSYPIPAKVNSVLNFGTKFNPDLILEHFDGQIAKVNYNRFEQKQHRLDIWLSDEFVAMAQENSVYPFTEHLVFIGDTMSDCFLNMCNWLKNTMLFADTNSEFAINWMNDYADYLEFTKRDIKDYLKDMSELKMHLLKKWSVKD